MSVMTVEAKAKAMRKKIAEYLLEFKGLSVDTVYSSGYKSAKLKDMTEGFTQSIAKDASEFVSEVEKLHREVAQQREVDERLYSPETDSDELLYYSQKNDYLRELEHSPGREIFSAYESALELANNKKAQMLEESAYGILLGKDRHLAVNFKAFVSRQKEARLSETVKSALERLPVFNSLSRTCERIISAASAGRLAESAIYAFYALSNFDDDGIIDVPEASFNIRRVERISRAEFELDD